MFKKILLTLVLCSATFPAWAASTPEQVVKEMLGKMKAAGNFTPIVDYIHWPTAYNQMVKNESNTAFVASSPEELRAVISEFVKSPSSVIKNKFVPSLGAMPEEQRQAVQQMLTAQFEQVDRQAKQREADFARATFNVKQATVTGGQAKVEVEQVLDGKTELWDLTLQQIEGSWYLPVFDPNFVNSPELSAMPFN